MRMHFRQSIAGLIILSLAALPPPASALFGVGDVVFDPSNYSENVITAARALKSNLNEAIQIANQLKQVEMEVRNLVNWPTQTWNEVKADIEQIKQLAQSSHDIGTAMTVLSAQFDRLYPGYQAQSAVNYEQQYKTWTDNTLKTINEANKVSQAQAANLPAETNRTQNAMTIGANAAGQMQALQTGNMLSGQLVTQLQELQLLQMAQMNAQNAYMATQIQNQSDEKAAIKRWLDSDKGYKSKM